VVYFFIQRKACATVAILLLGVTAHAQHFLDIQARDALQKRIAASIVELRITYNAIGMQDPMFKTRDQYLGVVIAKDLVATTSLAIKDPIESIRVSSLKSRVLTRCVVIKNSKKTGIIVLKCPGLSVKPAQVAKAPAKTGRALYSVQMQAGFITLLQGLYAQKAPLPLKKMFFVAGLNQPGMPLFDFKGRAVGLVIRPGIPFQSKVGVAAEIQGVFDEFNRSGHKKKGKGQHKPAQPNQQK